MAFEPLVIQSGQDWVAPMTVTDQAGHGLVVVDPVIEMRRDLNPAALLLARLDTTGAANGAITIVSPGVWTLRLPWQFTASMPRGRGFWDCFGLVNGQRFPVASGIVMIRPRVTA